MFAILKIVKGDYFDIEDNLITDGHINSLDFLELMVEIEKKYGIKLPIKDIDLNAFNSVDGICELLGRYENS